MNTAPGLAENTTLIGRMWAEGREMKAEVERLREANVALRQALVRIEEHARRPGDDALAEVALIARDAINENG